MDYINHVCSNKMYNILEFNKVKLGKEKHRRWKIVFIKDQAISKVVLLFWYIFTILSLYIQNA